MRSATFLGRNGAETWRHANPTPAPAQLAAFLDADPRPLPVPAPMQTHLSPGLLKATLTLLGAVVLGLIGAFLL